MSKIPINLERINKENLDKEIMRAGVIAELDTINLYKQMMLEEGKKEVEELER